MNELIFVGHVVVVLAAVVGALRLGRESLFGCVILQAIVANLLVLKQITLFGLTVTCSDVYIVGSLVGLHLLQELYGEEISKRATWATFGAMAFFAIVAQIHIAYAPAAVDTTQGAYSQLLGVAPRIAIASLISFLLSVRLNLWIFARLPGKVGLRSAAALIISQVVDTGLFCMIGLYGLVAHIGDIMIMSLAIKGIAIAAMAPLTGLLMKFARTEHAH